MCSTVDLVGVRGRAAAVDGRMNVVSSLLPFLLFFLFVLFGVQFSFLCRWK